MTLTLKTTLALFAGVVALAFSGCGSDSSSSSAKTGPAADGFAGATIKFNPTVNFTGGNTITYRNNEADSPFPAAAPQVSGTYSYVPNASLTAGTLTLVLPAPVGELVLNIRDFTRSGDNVTGFRAEYDGQTYPVTVSGGTLKAGSTGNTGGGGEGEARADDIPSAMRGTHVLTFHESTTTAITGVPADGTETTFTIGARTLSFDGRTLTDPVFYNGNDLEWLFKDGSIWWAVSKAVDGGLNEINVQGPYSASQVAFYGQYNDRPSTPVLAVDSDGKYVAGTTFNATVNSTSETSSGLAFNQTPKLTGTVHFSVLSDGSLQVSYGGGGVFSSFTAPFASANASSVTYRLSESGSPNKDYTIVIAKDASDQPTTVQATLIQSAGVRTTTHTYGLNVQN